MNVEKEQTNLDEGAQTPRTPTLVLLVYIYYLYIRDLAFFILFAGGARIEVLFGS
jgi:hypothetical protein